MKSTVLKVKYALADRDEQQIYELLKSLLQHKYSNFDLLNKEYETLERRLQYNQNELATPIALVAYCLCAKNLPTYSVESWKKIYEQLVDRFGTPTYEHAYRLAHYKESVFVTLEQVNYTAFMTLLMAFHQQILDLS